MRKIFTTLTGLLVPLAALYGVAPGQAEAVIGALAALLRLGPNT